MISPTGTTSIALAASFGANASTARLYTSGMATVATLAETRNSTAITTRSRATGSPFGHR